MNILYIEPYYSGSHKRWIDSYKNITQNKVDLLTLPGNKWKWRMHGGAITLAEKFKKQNKIYDLILCSDFLNLPVFKSYCGKILGNTPIVMYFHENQLSYPWSPKDKDLALKRDLHYHYINYTSSLVSDYNLFNSQFHLSSYIQSLKQYLKKMPDFNNFETINTIEKKSDILYIGCDLKKFDKHINDKKNDIPLIIWNHRWEFDKNPEVFFKTLFKIKDDNIDFNLVVLGEKFNDYPKIFDDANNILRDNILHFGFCESFTEYAKWVSMADILPVTSNQDFFGISIIEAVYARTTPLLPNRLSYPELFDINNNSDSFYSSDIDLYRKLKNLLIKNKNNTSFKLKKYDWNNLYKEYDKRFSDLAIKAVKLDN